MPTRPQGIIPNGIWTIQGPRGHRTVSIETQADDARFAPGKRVVSLLVGPDDWQGFGFVSQDSRIAVWTKYRGHDGQASDCEKIASVLVDLFLRPDTTPLAAAGYVILGEATCTRCNRRLTTPDSILAGIGPDCRTRRAGA